MGGEDQGTQNRGEHKLCSLGTMKIRSSVVFLSLGLLLQTSLVSYCHCQTTSTTPIQVELNDCSEEDPDIFGDGPNPAAAETRIGFNYPECFFSDMMATFRVDGASETLSNLRIELLYYDYGGPQQSL